MSGNRLANAQASLAFRLGVVGTVWLLYGCFPQAQPTVSPSLPSSSPSRTTLMTEMLAEAEDLRTAVAAERIKAAKQAANLRTAHNQVSAMRNREIEHLETITRLEKDLSQVQAERDHLQENRAELQKEIAQLRADTAKVPQLLAMVTQVRILETSLKGMVASIDALSKETAQLKKELNKQQALAARAQKPGSSGRAERGPHAEGTDSIVVKRGDSLWRLAHRYDTTVAVLKTLNHLESDLILIGQVLKIPAPAHPRDEERDEKDLLESLNANNQPNH